MNNKSIFYNYDNIKPEEIKQVNLFEANKYYLNGNKDACLNASGILLIKKIIDNFLAKREAEYYIDFSSLISTVENNELFDYVFLSNRGYYYFDIEKVKNYYFPLYDKLKQEGSGIYYQKGFFYSPLTDQYYISELSNVNNNNILPLDPGENLDLIKRENYWFAVSKININYYEFGKLINPTKISVQEAHDKFHANLSNYFLKNKNNYTYLLSIPIIGAPSSLNKPNGYNTYEGQGAIFLLLVSRKKFVKDVKKLAKQISYLIKDITYNYLFHSGLIMAERSRKNSIKSGVTAIMGRNMSHNIGSHVLSNLKNATSLFAKKLSENNNGEYFETLWKESIGKSSDNVNPEMGLHPKYFFGFTWLLNYLQERQDYIATISGFENQTFIPVNFKNFIIDGFLPDHQYERHQNGEVKNYTNFLLEYISKSENISRDKIKTYFRNYDTSKKTENGKTGSDSFDLMSAINISLPGGIIGRQAIFSIMENFIRNSSKHSKLSSEDYLQIIIDMPDLYYDAASKSIKIKKSYNKMEYDSNEYIKITLTDNIGSYSKAEGTIKKAISQELINKNTGELNSEYKGIKEMKISAAWLRGENISEIDDEEKHNPRILKVEKSEKISDTIGKNDSIKYDFYLLKPKELLILISDENYESLNLQNDFLMKFQAFGIELINESQIKNQTLFRHALFIIEKGIEKDHLFPRFNRRINEVEFEFIKNTVEEIKINEITEKSTRDFIAQYWLKRVVTCDPIFIADGNNFNRENSTEFFNYWESFTFKAENTEEDKKYNDALEKKREEWFKINKPKILFKNHNDTKNEFLEFKKDLGNKFSDIKFLEGITGGNSTDLYLRKLPKDELRYYKILESCRAKILIIDERLWNNNSSVSIEKITFSKMNDDGIKKILNVNKSIEDNNAWAKNMIVELTGEEHPTLIRVLASNKYFMNRNNKALIKDIRPHIKMDKNYEDNNEFKYNLYNKKGISIVNISFNSNYSECYFYELICDDKKPLFILKKESNILYIEKIGQCKFDILSIHQGIVDKIQEKMDVEMGIIFHVFAKSFENNTINIIHSGRSKPSSGVPKDFFFIPYASMENAFNDSKYSLTEVLYNVKGELL